MQQHDAHARGARRVDDGQRELVRLLVGRAVGPVVDVVELADRRVAGARAPRVEAAPRRRARIAARVERLGGRVHRLAPRSRSRRRGAGVDAARRGRAGARWKACECPLTRPGTSRRRGRRTTSSRSPASAASSEPRDAPADELDRDARAHARRRARARARGRAACGHGSIGRSSPRSRAVSQRDLVARVGVAHDARARIVREHALDAAARPRRCRRRRPARPSGSSGRCRRRRRGARATQAAPEETFEHARSGSASRRSRRSRRASPRSRGRARRPSPSRGGRARSRSARVTSPERTSSLKRRPARWRSP